jgi:spectinomycin phosphotransferase
VKPPPEQVDVGSLAQILASEWGFIATTIEHLPVGFSHHWVVADGAGERRFVTVDDLDRPAGLGLADLRRAFDTAIALRERAALEFVLAPLPTRHGASVEPLDSRYTVAVFPFVAGTPGESGRFATTGERADIVRLLAALHDSTPNVREMAPTCDWKLSGRPHFEAALRDLDHEWHGGPFSESVRRLLSRHIERIDQLLHDFDRMAADVEAAGEPRVITHGEPKAGNLIRGHERLVLVDWDTVAMAAPERDLWLVDDGSGDQLRIYAEVTGRRINSVALDLYRLAWDLADLFLLVSTLRLPHPATAENQAGLQHVSDIINGCAPLTSR